VQLLVAIGVVTGLTTNFLFEPYLEDQVLHADRRISSEEFLLPKGSPMFTADQYRAKAIEYSKLLRTANGPNEVREYQRLERSFTELADNAQWMIDNHDKSLHATAHATAPATSSSAAQIDSQ
jgi:hypothetical protein